MVFGITLTAKNAGAVPIEFSSVAIRSNDGEDERCEETPRSDPLKLLCLQPLSCPPPHSQSLQKTLFLYPQLPS